MLKTLAASAALALAATTASAFTLSAENDIEPGGTYDVLSGPYLFNASFFDVSDDAGSFSFNFVNSSSSAAAITTTVGSAVNLGIGFAGGVQYAWDGMTKLSCTAAATDGCAGVFSHTIAAGATGVLSITYGDSYYGSAGRGRANIDVAVDAAAVPVPAAGVLLVGALGGLAALRRRKA